MGTHPIFESDFDCLTVYRKVNLTMTDYDKGNVVTSQPGGPSEWSTPLCGAACCCGHPAAECCKAWCCPCLVHGAVAEKLGDDRGHWTLGTFFCLVYLCTGIFGRRLCPTRPSSPTTQHRRQRLFRLLRRLVLLCLRPVPNEDPDRR